MELTPNYVSVLVILSPANRGPVVRNTLSKGEDTKSWSYVHLHALDAWIMKWNSVMMMVPKQLFQSKERSEPHSEKVGSTMAAVCLLQWHRWNFRSHMAAVLQSHEECRSGGRGLQVPCGGRRRTTTLLFFVQQ